MTIRVGRCRVCVEVAWWRVPVHAPRLVLWGGGRPLDVQVGSRVDRLRVLEQHAFSWVVPRVIAVSGSTSDLRLQVAEQIFGRAVVEAHAMPEHIEKLRAYSGERGWDAS